jgi:galactose mutarotase-like enzyme
MGSTNLNHSVRDALELLRLSSLHLEVDVAPQLGGRTVQIRHRDSGHAFLWNNKKLPLAAKSPGSEYDPNFYGGIDELIPTGIAEVVDGVASPDHGELWTTALKWEWRGEQLLLQGRLPLCGLSYERRMTLRSDSPIMDLHYRIVNETNEVRHFSWTLHAALAVEEGDRIDCSAKKAQVADPAYSRFASLDPFAWPDIEGQRADCVPAQNGTCDFFYLYDLQRGRIAWARASQQLRFEYRFDTSVFPFAMIFATYGGFLGHYTVLLEPCTAMPLSVNEAKTIGRCTRLEPGEALESDVSIYAGFDL